MAPTQIYRVNNAMIKEKDGSKILTTSYTDDYIDCELDLSKKGAGEIECLFNPYPGDKVKLYLLIVGRSPVVYRIDPWEEMTIKTGQVTYLTRSFGVVDNNIVWYIEKHTFDREIKIKVGDKVECRVIEGKYTIGRDRYEYRCESIKKVAIEIDATQMDLLENQNANGIENVDSESKSNGKDRQMEYEPFQNVSPNKLSYKLPNDLFDILTSKQPKTIKSKLDSMVPRELNYKTYKTRLHALVYLEEVEVKKAFEMYECSHVWIEPKKGRFSINCSTISEIRPPIAIGDQIEVRKHQNPNRLYRGSIERVLKDRFILKFKEDFVNDFIAGAQYSAEFIYSRAIFRRMHAAIDYEMKFSEEFLFPTKLIEASDLQIKAKVSYGQLLIDAKAVPWFTTDLNDEQKQSVAAVLRGECRPMPHIIFGPPGTGKTSTLIEIILQVFKHVKNSRIVIATQSNHVANVLSNRLIAKHPEMAVNLFRLVSNAILDQQLLPENLLNVSGSVLSSHAVTNGDDPFEFEEAHPNIKRNMSLQYLKDYKIIVGTCDDLRVLSGSELSRGYFSHVMIDEASQCSEMDSLIPISFVDQKGGQIIISGDPLQLPPLTLSPHAKCFDLVKSMMERYLEMYRELDGAMPSAETGFDPRLVTMLRRNYRALPNVLVFYNKQFYNFKLIPTICGETSPESNELTNINKIFSRLGDATVKKPVGYCFVNIEGKHERSEKQSLWKNKEEMTIIRTFISEILEQNIAQDDIGVITPYFSEVQALRKELKSFKRVKVGTVEDFQGDEKKVIIVSTMEMMGTMCHEKAQFVFCPKRLNTTISRARVCAIIFGKTNFLSIDQDWADLISHCHENGFFVEGRDILQMP